MAKALWAPTRPLNYPLFVGLIASLMALNAVAIDAMLPALSQIAQAVGVTEPNHAQWIVTAYVLGLGSAQLFYGSLADRFGRRPVLLIGIAIYIVFSVLAGFAQSFEMMLAARVLEGVGAAATRVLSVSMVRDRYSGRQMARVMSMSFIVFLAVPIIAPSLGQLIVLVAPWPWMFFALGLFGAIVFAWIYFGMPETLHPEDRLPLQAKAITEAFRLVLTNRMAVGYTLASTALFGGLMGFVGSAQQIFTGVFGLKTMFPLAFAAIAVFVGIASLLNARIVGRLGSRKVSHAALFGFIFFACIHSAVALSDHETIWTFMVLQPAMMFCFGLIASNFGSMAMEPLGKVAGTASSAQGFISTLGGAVIGFFIGQAFDGTAAPLVIGFALGGIASLGFVLFAEKGRLFVSHEQPIDADGEPVMGHM